LRLLTKLAGGVLTAAVASAAVLSPLPAMAGTEPDARLILHYKLNEGSGTVAADSSGNGRNGTVINGGVWNGEEGLSLDGADDYVKLPDNLMRDLTSITVSTDVLIAPDQVNPYFIYGLGNVAGTAGNGYLFTSGDSYRTSIASGNWSTEQTLSANKPLDRGVWKNLTYTLAAGTATLYVDGDQVAQRTGISLTPGSIGQGNTTANFIGKSLYGGDKYLHGSVRDFRVFNTGLSVAEVKALAPTDQTRTSRDRAALSLGDLSAVTSNVTLPRTGANGSSITWSSNNPEVISADGAVNRPAGVNAEVLLTATITRGTSTLTAGFTATVLRTATDAETVADAASRLALPNTGDVRGNITLPGMIGAASINWASSQPAIIDGTGIVTRQNLDSTVRLTATLTAGTESAAKNFDLIVKAKPNLAPMEGYAFAYFTGNSIAGENISMAASQGNNALQWTELNGGQPILTSTLGTKGLRDPFLIRSPEGDKFFMIATDLSIGSGTTWGDSQTRGSQYLEVWESADLKTWSQQRHVKVSPPTAGNTWAPEAYWDAEQQSYIVFWASQLYAESDPNHTGSSYNRMLYATTRDFVTFSEPKIWQDRGQSRIDSTVIRENGTYYRFTKDEGGGGTGCSDIIQEKSTNLTAVDLPGNPSWAMVDSCIGRDAGTSAVEGPTVFKANPGDTSGSNYYLFVDEYGGRGYIPLGTSDIANPDWKVPATYRLPASPRHGTVIPVTKSELDALNNAPAPLRSNADGLVAHYPLTQGSGLTVTDASGNGNNATISGDTSWSDDALMLGGTNGHVKLPDNAMAGMNEITVSMDVNIASNQATPYFIWGMGNTGPGGAGNGYLFNSGDAYRASIATGNWTTEQTATSGKSLPRNVWKTLTYTLDVAGTARVYLDGTKVAEKTGVTIKPGDIGGGNTTANYIGRSVYTSDKYLSGKIRNFRLYNKALAAASVGALEGNGTAIVDATLASLKTAATIDPAAGTVTLPVKAGTNLKTLDPTYTLGTGSVLNPSGPRDYSQPVSLTVMAPNGATRTWTVTALEVRSPVIPGLYADPNIAEFNGTYYIYATTDGFEGWGGKEFYVWKSTNLVDWTKSAQPILRLDGANGNVPWATGNAWAPTIIEKNEKYYFYFSGHNSTYDRKSIGVAVSNSPEGPFTAEPTAMILNNENITSGQAIDPAAFKDPATGKHYLFWGNGSPVYAELSDDMLTIKAGTIQRINGLTDFREGSFMNYRNGLYHLTYSIDDTGSENYRVGYATALSINGPWTYRGVILEKDPVQGILATGHSSIVQAPGTDDWYIAYHRFAIPGGDGEHRETTIDKVELNSDGTFKRVTPTLTSVPALSSPQLSVTAVTTTRCLAGNAYVTVVAKNGETTPIDISVSSTFGSKSFNMVLGGKNISHAFNTRSKSIEAGVITTTAKASLNGKAITTTIKTDYEAKNCG
jgi:hypothetical protein